MAFFGLVIQLNAQIKIDHDRYVSLIDQGRCNDLISEVIQLRNSKEYGKSWIIDYYLAMGFCCSGHYETAFKGFNYIQHEYPINAEINNLLTQSKSFCRPSTTIDYRFELAKLIVSNGQSGTRPPKVSGKLGFVFNCDQDSWLYEFDNTFDQSELQNRLFEIDEAALATDYYNSFLPERKYNVNASGRFIFVTPAKKKN